MMLGVDYIQLQGGSKWQTVLGHLSRLLISTMTAMPMLSSAPRSLVAPMYIMGWLRRPYQLQLLMLRLLVRPRDFASPMTNLTWDHRLPASATSTTMVMMMWRLEHLLLLLSVLFFGNEYMRNDDAPAEYKCDD